MHACTYRRELGSWFDRSHLHPYAPSAVQIYLKALTVILAPRVYCSAQRKEKTWHRVRGSVKAALRDAQYEFVTCPNAVCLQRLLEEQEGQESASEGHSNGFSGSEGREQGPQS